MSLNSGLFSSKTDMWATPQYFFDKWNLEFNFTIDVCATSDNAKCKNFFTEATDGLTQEWNGVVWMNPPYGREIGKWVKKAFESAKGGGNRCLSSTIKNRHKVVA